LTFTHRSNKSARLFLTALLRAWEKVGQVPNVVFVEGMVQQSDRWLFYYGGADKYVGVAVAAAVRPIGGRNVGAPGYIVLDGHNIPPVAGTSLRGCPSVLAQGAST
jgi:hypothetical protein